MREKIDRYEVREEIGRGGMAEVFYAFDPRMQRDVAIKVLLREMLTAPQIRERFSREARVIAGLDHPAIVPVYDYGEDDGDPYIVMRYMGGGSLQGKLKKGGPLPIDEAALIMQRIGTALDRAHTMGIIHRDVKPGNILFDQYGNAFLSDFGIVKILEAGSSMTGTGAFFGTPHYMSPEQVSGEADLDGRSDIYALAVILYEMLTGKTPYDADTPMAVAFKHAFEAIPLILDYAPGLPAEIVPIIDKGMAKDRQDRYQTGAEMAADLIRIANLNVDELLKSTGAFDRKAADKRREELETARRAEVERKEGEADKEALSNTISPTIPPPADTKEIGIDDRKPTVVASATTEGPSPVSPSRGMPAWGWAAIGLVLLGLILGALYLNNQQNAVAEATDEPTAEVIATEEETEEPEPTATRTPRPTATAEPTEEPTEQPTEEVIVIERPRFDIVFSVGRGTAFDIFGTSDSGRPDCSNCEQFTEGRTDQRQADWSPDGSKIAYRARTSTGRLAIFVMNPDGSEVTQLTDGESNDYDPSWSPDGTQIVFVSERDGSVPDLFIMNADGSDQHQLTFTDSRELGPRWSPDGEKILFFSDQIGGFELYTINPNGRSQQRLTSNTFADYDPVWSPDGTQIAYVSESGGSPDIWIMDADGSNRVRLTSDGAADIHPAWSPDGTMIVFSSRREGSVDLWLVNVDGSDEFALTRMTGSDEVDPTWLGPLD